MDCGNTTKQSSTVYVFVEHPRRHKASLNWNSLAIFVFIYFLLCKYEDTNLGIPTAFREWYLSLYKYSGTKTTSVLKLDLIYKYSEHPWSDSCPWPGLLTFGTENFICHPLLFVAVFLASTAAPIPHTLMLTHPFSYNASTTQTFFSNSLIANKQREVPHLAYTKWLLVGVSVQLKQL